MYFIGTSSGSASADPTLGYLGPTGANSFEVASVAPQFTPFEEWAIAGLSDGGGVWAAWWGNAGVTGSEVVLQLFLPDAGPFFDAGAQNGFQLSALPSTDDDPGTTLIGDGTGGVTAVWYAVTAGAGALYAQHIATDGGALWGANPILVSSAESTPREPDGYLSSFRVIAGPGGNPTILWIGSAAGVYAEQLDLATGTKLWGSLSGGIEVSTVYSPAYMDIAFGTDDSAYVTYEDDVAHIYVKRIEPGGTLGGVVPDAGPALDAGADGGTDAGMDAGIPDAGEDAGVEDAGIHDAGAQDAGPLDAGVVDAGPAMGSPDAGPIDAGTAVDAGKTPDAGSTLSASSGCSCSSGNGGLPASLGLFLGTLVLRRRRSR
jgi:MYXO-CTERM domain-containing protein